MSRGGLALSAVVPDKLGSLQVICLVQFSNLQIEVSVRSNRCFVYLTSGADGFTEIPVANSFSAVVKTASTVGA